MRSLQEKGKKVLCGGGMMGPSSHCCLLETTLQLLGVVSLLSFYLPLVWAQQQQQAADTVTLLIFKEQLEADPTGLVNSTWNGNSLDAKGCPRNWYGVNCSEEGRVNAVVLENVGLHGELKSGTLGDLQGLEILSLANNSFSGYLPDDLGNLVNMRSLNLSNNLFEGMIPSDLFKLPLLNNLSLAGNGLSGSIPLDLGVSLNVLDLSGNNLSGGIPATLVQLQQLVQVNLSMNNFDGSIPSGVQNLIYMDSLDFHGNQLSGTIDPGLLGLNKTRFIDLSSNNFSGLLPWQQSQSSFPSGFSVVEHVNLSHNQLSDSLSAAGVVFAAKLMVLDISNNKLFGELPSFEFATALTTLVLSGNAFVGSIPSTLISGPSSLMDLDLSANQLTGSIGPVTANYLITLNLSNNNLSGALPASIGSCESVDLSNNLLSGDLSVMQSWGPTIQSLDLSNNQLSGLLYAVEFQLYQLTSINLSHNMLTGVVPQPFASSRSLSKVDLSFNQFSGGIPISFFYSTVTALLLSHNQFGGPIPLSDAPTSASAPGSTFVSSSYFQVLADSSSLSPLLVLDLSSNNLTHSIPGKIGSISTLEILNLSANKLSGQIPSQLNELTSLQGLDLSENQLSGPLPPQLPKSLRELNFSRNNLSGSVPKSLTRFPQSSFFPGNTALLWPIGGARRPFSVNNGGLKPGVKAGLIGGCTAGAALVFALGLLVYYKSTSKSKDTSPGSEYDGSQKGFESCGKPKSNRGTEFDGDVEHGPPSVLPGVATGKSVRSKRGRSSPNEKGSPEVNEDNVIDVGDLVPIGHRQPISVAEDVMSPEHPLVAKVSPEHPVDVGVKEASPEQLVGNVFFFEKGVSFTSDDLSMAPAEVLGRSSHGTSYKAILAPDQIMVVKWLKEGLAKSKKDFGMEAKKFGNIKHQNIVPMKGYYWGPREHEKLVLSEYVMGASLDSRLFERTGVSQPVLTWEQRLKVAVDVSSGLVYLHARHHWAHGNIKASNILLTGDSHFEARLSDYSLHRLMTSDGTTNQIVNASALGYCAPELSAAKKPKPSMKSDVFSFGVILMELITGKSAGDIISGHSGVVDLPDWVKLVANEGHAIDCYDTALVGVDRDLEPPKGIDEALAISLNCAAPQKSRPSMRIVHEGLASINPV